MDKEKKPKQNTNISGWLIIVYILVLLVLAVFVKRCVPDDDYDEEYEEYLNEYYDGAGRYDPV